uniref:Reverse transcriptase N-terminal domain-containing protein n=1 Tax=Symphyocladiella dendroidea TaxID=2506487 RepID=A0A1Z1M7X3_9FLOR|nr:hypothetical protein [Symphyocladiella dendroidea]ARW61854.1 hypothetical protein [Symphyocladiella dendroidea]
MITKQIYIAMKKYDLIYVYKLQQYIMNCNEFKIMLVNKMFCDLILHYDNCNNMKCLIKQINRLDILKSLITKKSQSYQMNSIIIEYIKQDLIYKSIEPTWTAKISKKLTKFINKTQLANSVSSYHTVNNKCFLTNIIIKKLSSYNYINKSISIWLYHNVYLNLSKIHNLKYKKYIIESKNNKLEVVTQASECLYLLINQIIINDAYWYTFNHIRKINSVWKAIDNVEIIILDNTNNLVQTFNIIFKHLLYRKTYKGFIKINVFDNNILNKVKFLYKYYYSYIISFISFGLIENCNKLMNCFNYILIKKQINQNLNKSEYIYSLKLINQILNKYIYFYNIEYFYQYTELGK